MGQTGVDRKTAEILLIEDNPSDALLMQEALQVAATRNELHVTVNGDEALDYLYRKGKYEHVPRPDLIMLDLNLPKRDGREVLAQIKNDPDLKRIPVVVITTSRSEEDILGSYRLHANCYITKPVRLHDFFQVVKQIDDFWFSSATLPPRVDDE